MDKMNIRFCNNCGSQGHIYRHCTLPVLSYGIICFTNENKLLMIQRKDSISYIEFLRGKYELSNQSYILKLLNGCSIRERDLIKSLSFDELWEKLWFTDVHGKKQTDRMLKEYKSSLIMFEALKQSTLEELMAQCTNMYDTPEWEFPKGRRSSREINIRCAIREFEEETDLSNEEYILLENILPISEEYTGSNGFRYKHIYYYALYTGSRDLSINDKKYEQFTEIGDIQWLTIPECLHKIRKEHPTKNDILHKCNEFLVNWKHDFILKE
jgi:8-oxo-dGTP pyrophosphatase MutT (NUDIX family)